MSFKKIFKRVGLIVVIVLFVAAAFLVISPDEGGGFHALARMIVTGGTWKMKNVWLPSCGSNNDLFTYYPVDLQAIDHVSAQGEFSPGDAGHTFPIKHVYTLDKFSNAEMQANIRPKVEMVAPSDGWITGISQYHNVTKENYEYYVSFAPCREVYVDFFHMSDLSPRIKAVFENNLDKSRKESSNPGTVVFETIGQQDRIKVRAGEAIGAASTTMQQMFDFSLFDTRIPQLAFVNKARFLQHDAFDLTRVACPYDYFADNIKTALYSKIANWDNTKKRAKAPLCGEYMQDLAGTAQGAWFLAGTKNGLNGNDEDIIARENLHLALAHEAYDPQRPVLSIGESLEKSGLQSNLYFIKTKSSGQVNRDWKDITADGKIYCADLSYGDGTADGQSVIVQMPTSTTLKMEKLGACGAGPWSFSNKATEFER